MGEPTGEMYWVISATQAAEDDPWLFSSTIAHGCALRKAILGTVHTPTLEAEGKGLYSSYNATLSEGRLVAHGGTCQRRATCSVRLGTNLNFRQTGFQRSDFRPTSGAESGRDGVGWACQGVTSVQASKPSMLWRGWRVTDGARKIPEAGKLS